MADDLWSKWYDTLNPDSGVSISDKPGDDHKLSRDDLLLLNNMSVDNE